MDEELGAIHEHMRQLGLGALGHANWHANFVTPESEWWSELSVLQAAHAAEILIKARIAQEHPLLIFERLPSSGRTEPLLTIQLLAEEGRTVQFANLPDRLWAIAGVKVPSVERYHSFGRLRNTIQHFASPIGIDMAEETLRFIYEVVDPFINEAWGLCAVNFVEDYEGSLYLVDGLIRRGISFLVSAQSIRQVDITKLDWPKGPAFRELMEARFEAARATDARLDARTN